MGRKEDMADSKTDVKIVLARSREEENELILSSVLQLITVIGQKLTRRFTKEGK
jgi:hypothetical protein